MALRSHDQVKASHWSLSPPPSDTPLIHNWLKAILWEIRKLKYFIVINITISIKRNVYTKQNVGGFGFLLIYDLKISSNSVLYFSFFCITIIQSSWTKTNVNTFRVLSLYPLISGQILFEDSTPSSSQDTSLIVASNSPQTYSNFIFYSTYRRQTGDCQYAATVLKHSQSSRIYF